MPIKFDGPIPGENYTSNTKNYPWHRPPEYTDLDTAIEASFKKLTDEDNAVGLLTMLDQGVTVAQVASMFVISGIGGGKWTPDFAMILAGPIAHIIYLLAKGYGINCDLGIDKKKPIHTSSYFSSIKKINENKLEEVIDSIDISEVTGGNEGFMGMGNSVPISPAPADVQNEMLGRIGG